MTAENIEESASFEALNLAPDLLAAVAAEGYEEPTAIQQAAIPALIAGRDVLGLAATGTGKTAAFTLPMLHRILELPKRRAPRGLVLVPTRELALQVARAVHRYGKVAGIRVVPLYGGADFRPQLKSLSRGVDVVVATPGRALDHLDRGTLRLDEIAFAVLDEADEMLDMGFQEDLETLLGATPPDRQTALFSATFPARLRKIAKAHLTNAERIEVERTALSGDEPAVRQVAVVVRRDDKVDALIRILDLEAPEAAIIFCRTRHMVDELADTLAARGYRVEALHGGFNQNLRERVMSRLRAGANDLLIATDVAARGIDVAHLTHVFNFDLPDNPAQYVHRIGRTGRAGRSGMAVSICTRRDKRLVNDIERHTGGTVEILPVPRVEDLRRRQLARMVRTATETLAAGELDLWLEPAATLLTEEDPQQVVAALLRMLHENDVPDLDEEDDDRDLNALRRGPPPPRPDRGSDGGPDRGSYGGPDRGSYGGPDRGPQQGPPAHHSGHWARLWVSIGREEAVRPGDLVGAIANESGLDGSDIGRIQIHQRFSLVEVRADAAGHVIDRMRGATVRNVKVNIREDREA